MKTRLFSFLPIRAVTTVSAVFLALLVAGCSKQTGISPERQKQVVVYTYDSFEGEWGAGPEIAKRFAEATGYTVVYVNCGDGAQILSKALLEKKSPQADVLLGLDNNLAGKARSEQILAPYKPKDADSLLPESLPAALGGDWLLTPYDYSLFAIIYDTQSSVPAPASLSDLAKPEYRQKLILMDPRTSTPGLGFAAWTVAEFGEAYTDFWKALQPSILTMAPSWSAGYGLFTQGEAPLAVSYITSPAYHIAYDNTNRYQALIFAGGHVQQVEGAGIVNGAPNRKAAEAFIDFLISSPAQDVLPLTQWMYPANKHTVLPECYAGIQQTVPPVLPYNPETAAEAIPAIMRILGK